MTEETGLSHKNRCYVFVNNNINVICKICHANTIVKEYQYRGKKRIIKGFANYCPACDIYYLYYGNYVGQIKHWKVMNTEEDMQRLSAEYNQLVIQKNGKKLKRQLAIEKKAQKSSLYYEIPGQNKKLEKERIERNEKAIENRRRGEKEKEKTDEIKRKLELKEEQRLQQLRESEEKREREFKRRLAESRRRSEERKRNAKRGIILEAEIKKPEPIIPVKQAEPKKQAVLPDSELKSAENEFNGQFDLRKHLIENGHLKNLQKMM